MDWPATTHKTNEVTTHVKPEHVVLSNLARGEARLAVKANAVTATPSENLI